MEKYPDPHRKTGLFMLAIAWILVFSGIYWFFDEWYQRQYNPNSSTALLANQSEVVLQQNRAGHYVVQGVINGTSVTFLVDTGATQVAISEALANQLGVRQGGNVSVQTANGTVAGFSTRLEMVRIGTIEVHDVSALVAPGLEDDTVLLGMSFLKHVEFTQRNGKLILKPL